MTEIISGLFLLAGSLFILLSAIGVLRMPDLFTRMSATTKASTLGVGFVLIGTAFFWMDRSGHRHAGDCHHPLPFSHRAGGRAHHRPGGLHRQGAALGGDSYR